ncbi:hypothetical protein LCGC14_0593130 [marine sediment metagenome]|uniref:Uncharacterized protein n=1 Tax=marine sediment metagenome TaxID=412755 RepID=A0A0F9RCT2_9ZZZZ
MSLSEEVRALGHFDLESGVQEQLADQVAEIETLLLFRTRTLRWIAEFKPSRLKLMRQKAKACDTFITWARKELNPYMFNGGIERP